MPDQLVVLIGSDDKRATVSRSVATQASLVLRDLLDGKEPTTRHMVDVNDGDTVNNATTSLNKDANIKEEEEEGNTNNIGTPAFELPFPYFTGALLQRVCAHMTYRYGCLKSSGSCNSGGNCDGRKITSVGEKNSNTKGCSSDGAVQMSSGRNVMRKIPRPMVLPLNEYLDHYDRCFIKDWDEKTTVLMVKAATLLNYEELLDLASAKLAVYLSEKSVEGIRAFLGVESDFTPEEEAELKKEHEYLTGK